MLLAYPPRRLNGAFITSAAFLRGLAARGHDVHVVHTGRDGWEIDGVQVHPRHQLTAVTRAGVDVVIHHHGHDGNAKEVANSLGVHLVTLVHGEHRRNRALGNPGLVWFGTDAARAYYEWTGPRLVVPPPIRPGDYATTPGAHVTLVGLSAAKGVDVFHAVARALPDVAFLGVKSAYDRQHRLPLPNVTYADQTADMRADVYARTKVLLMPSTTETFGRVGIEAMCSGIPVVAHPTPGMVEAFGSGATFVDRNDPGGWAKVVNRLMTDADAWAEASERAHARAADLDYDTEVGRVVAAVERVAGKKPARWDPNAPRFCVTGTGRSGTKYMRAVLDVCGVKAGHEDWWNPDPVGRVAGLQGDVSWLAVPDLEARGWAGPTVLVTRHPVATVRSLIGAYFLTSGDSSPYSRFALTYEPELAGMEPVRQAVEWWARWNTRAAQVADIVVRVEDMADPVTLQRVSDVIGYPLKPDAAATVPTDVHHGGRADIPAEHVWDLLNDRAEMFGYKP